MQRSMMASGWKRSAWSAVAVAAGWVEAGLEVVTVDVEGAV
jgi:hypothetical protein